jgi:hypothetical protein
LKILIHIEIIYYITELKHSEISIFWNTALMNIRKYQIYSRLVQLGSRYKRMFQKYEIPSKYVMKIYSKRHSMRRRITNWQALREWESGCAVVYCANLS